MSIEAIINHTRGIPYDFDYGPLTNYQGMPEKMNCQLFIHLAVKHFLNIELPKWLRSLEIFYDNNFFESIDSCPVRSMITDYNHTAGWNQNLWESFTRSLQLFDIALFENHNFGTDKRHLPQFYHLGLVIAQDELNTPLIAHCTQPQYFNGDSSIFNQHTNNDSSLQFWPLDKMIKMTQYAQISGIRRLKSVPDCNSYLLKLFNQSPQDPYGIYELLSSDIPVFTINDNQEIML